MTNKTYDDSNWREEALPNHRGKQADLLRDAPKSLSQSWIMGAMYNEWKRRNGYDKLDPKENEGQHQSSMKEWEESIKKYSS